MSMLSTLPERITIRKADGRTFEDVRASVQSKMVFIGDASLPIEVGDVIERTRPGGVTDRFDVMDPGYFGGHGGIQAHFQCKVRRIQEESTPSSIAQSGGERTIETRNIAKVFICHSSLDLELVRQLVDLLKAALRLRSIDIRCTSLSGHKLESGANVDDTLRREVHESESFIGVISESSLQSTYCVFEMGGRWGSPKELRPLAVPGLNTSAIPKPLSGLNLLRADSDGDIDQLISDVAGDLGIVAEPSSSFRHLTARIATQQSAHDASPAAKPHDNCDIDLSDGEITILRRIAQHDGAVMWSDLLEESLLQQIEAEHYLDRLNAMQLISYSHIFGARGGTQILLRPRGREYIVTRGLLDRIAT